MSLFQKIIVKKYLENLPSDLIEGNYKKYTKYFNDFGRAERIRALKEEQYQEGFLRELFVECLNYTINPDENFNLTTEFKNKTDAEKADGAILKNGKPIAVIELKSARTKDLKTIEKQAFNYKAHQSNCKYIITSNFEKIRLYINDATEFEEFNVFQLSENEFKFLYLCFSKESIFKDIPAIIKEKSNQHEDLISKKLYNDYSVFRNNIFQNLTKNNPQIDKLILFKKSQKLLDRFLFIFFAEDKGLIPANIISKVIEDYNKLQELDHYTPLYNEFKKYFSYINIGNEKLSIDAYNGGLFQFDEILDNVKIDDEILINDSLKLSNYDFDSEIDVNILGHIFEHSLTDIEKLNAEISGEDLDKKQTRRKKEGVFYTPNYITKYIVENTVGTLCNEKKNELKLNNLEIDKTYFKKTKNALTQKGEQLFETLEIYKDWLLSLKILDPACGSGAFLNQALNFLIDEHNFIIDLETDLRKGQLSLFDIDTAVLENNLYGVDINEESVEIAKLSLWLKTAKKGRKLTDLNEHIKCGNSLIDDPEIAGEKAFDWNKEFPEIMQNGGFDVVIGNPPYGAKLLQKEKKHFYNKFVTVEYQIDTYTLFIEQAYNLLRKNGHLGFIIPSTWLTMYYFKNLRKFLIENCAFENLLLFKYQVFNEVTAETLIITLSKRNINTKNIKINHYNNYIETETKPYKFISQNDWKKCYELGFNLFFGKDKLKIINKMLNKSIELSNIIDVTVGIKPYQTNKGKPKQTKEDVKNRIFDANTKIDETFKNYIVGGNITKFLIVPCKTNWLKFGNFLAEPRQSLNFFQTKIMVRQTSDKIISAIDYNGQLSLNNVHNMVLRNDVLKYEVLVCILNSKLMDFYYNFLVPEKGRTFAEVKAVNLKRLPIIIIPESSQQPFIEKANLMLSLNKQKQEKINNFLHRIETNFEIEKFTNKMKAFCNYDYKTLISELKKKKIKLSFSQQDEFEEYFNSHKDEINELQNQITKTDKEIDQMVYELYGLTEEEIEIVENE